MEMLQLNDLHKTFNPGTVNEKVALNGVSLHMEAGDFATIVGSNGAGKSTLFNAVAGDFLIDAGSITLDGADITYQPAYRRSRRIGRLFQDPMRGTAPHMTIEENLAIAYLRASTSQHAFFSRISKKDKKVFRDHLALLGMDLENRMRQPVGLLSGGQRQALTLLMATLQKPKLLLLDEPFSALDYQQRLLLADEVHSIIKRGGYTAVLVTHDISEAICMSDRVIILSERPARIRKQVEINMGSDTPLERRSNPLFREYYDAVWSELRLAGQRQQLMPTENANTQKGV